MTGITLGGCTAEPLMCYLKSLGILRLLGEQQDQPISGYWDRGRFVLDGLPKEALVDFFCEHYSPTPVITPWNSASGFFGGSPAENLKKIAGSDTPRFEPYRRAINDTRAILTRLKIEVKPVGEEKQALVNAVRSELDDDVVSWIDALGVLSSDRLIFAPVLGTGGNDGRLEFAVNFHSHLLRVISLKAGSEPAVGSDICREWLIFSLFAEGNPALISASSGQFHPGAVGGPNSMRGFIGDAVVNPWDYILMIEGSLLLAGSVACRSGLYSTQKAAFPFTVRPTPGGWHTIADSDLQDARYEIWLPLWERPAGKAEVAHLLREGRAQVGKRAAENGSDFARAAAGLGVERGISHFTRFGFYKRSGKAYLASPLGRLDVRFQKDTDLIDEADFWLRSVRIASREPTAPGSLKRAHRAAENAIFAYCRRGRAEELQDLLIALSLIEDTVARSRDLKKNIAPLTLSLRWLNATDDGSSEFRLARAVASIVDFDVSVDDSGIRSNLTPVVRTELNHQWRPDSTVSVWQGDNLIRNLDAVLSRRCLDATPSDLKELTPIDSHYYAPIADISAFIEGNIDETRTGSLIRALAMLRWPRVVKEQRAVGYDPVPPEINRLYAIIKLFFHHRPYLSPEMATGQAAVVRPYQEMLTRLRQGHGSAALKLAFNRLKIAGLTPLGTAGGRGLRMPDIKTTPLCSRRIAAALLFPIDSPLPLAGIVLRNIKPAMLQNKKEE